LQYVAYAFVQSPRKVSCAALNVTIASPGFGCRYSSRSFTQALNLTAVPLSGQRLLISSRHGRPTTRERGDRLHSCARDHAGLAVRGFERLFFQGLRCFPGRPAVAQRSALRWGASPRFPLPSSRRRSPCRAHFHRSRPVSSSGPEGSDRLPRLAQVPTAKQQVEGKLVRASSDLPRAVRAAVRTHQIVLALQEFQWGG
jgi:hypothetical protein